MTCVIGFKSAGSIYIGADGAATSEEGDIRPIQVNKIFRNGPYLIGYCGSIRAGQILSESRFEIPESIEIFVEAIRDRMETTGCLVTTEFSTSMAQSNFIIAYKDELYEILSDFSLNKIYGDFTSVGCGASYAFGAMEVIKEMDLSPTKMLKKALEVVSKYNSAVRPPYTIKKY